MRRTETLLRALHPAEDRLQRVRCQAQMARCDGQHAGKTTSKIEQEEVYWPCIYCKPRIGCKLFVDAAVIT